MFQKAIRLLGGALLVATLSAACGVSSTAEPSASAAIVSSAEQTMVMTDTSAMTAADVLAENSADQADVADESGESVTATPITLQGDSITVDGAGAIVANSTVTITAAGAYRIGGTLDNGRIVVDTEDGGVVRLILDGVNVHNATGAAIHIADAGQAVIVLADQSENTLSDGASYVFADPEEDEPNAALFSKADLTIEGSGSLFVDANYNDGITSKDGLTLAGGVIRVDAIDDGIRGKDYLVVKDGAITVNAQGDGLKSDNDEDATRGYIAVEAGVIQVAAGGDAIQAETDIVITGGELVLSAGGGHAQLAEDASAKGIKAAVSVVIEDGSFAIDTADDAIHSNGAVVIHGGNFTIASGDDGIHADTSVSVNGGEIQITQSHEGIEGAVITLNAGTIRLVAGDDGVNVAGGNDSSAMGRGPGQDTFTNSGSRFLYINGGYLVVDAAGDGIDVNGVIEMTGGVVIVNGPTERMNGPLDYDAGFTLSGGVLVAAGSAGMAQAPGTTSTQPAVLLVFDSTQPAGTAVHVQGDDGKALFTFIPAKEFQSIAFSSPDLEIGTTYHIYLGGAATGTGEDGLYRDSSYTPGTEYTSFTVADVITQIGASGMNRRR